MSKRRRRKRRYKTERSASLTRFYLYWVISLIVLFILIISSVLFFVFKKQDNSISQKDTNFSTQSNSGSNPYTPSRQQRASTIKEKEETTFSEQTTEKPEYTLQSDSPVILMKKGDTFSPKISGKPYYDTTPFTWSSENSSVASVSSTGKITAKSDGHTSIKCQLADSSTTIYVNVVTDTPNGEQSSLMLYNKNGKELSYRLYHQSARNYKDYNSYLAQHGCAHCSLSTVLGAFSDIYKEISPDEVIATIEKNVASFEDWNKHHVTRAVGNQMPLSMYGITQILNYEKIHTNYVRTYEKNAAKREILEHLRMTGNPVIFEVRKQSNITGEKSTRWTGSIHTMVFLGVYTTGEVLVCDSVNRQWYNGGQRAKIVSIDDPMEFMYPCTKFYETTYFKSVSSDGGYILVE